MGSERAPIRRGLALPRSALAVVGVLALALGLLLAGAVPVRADTGVAASSPPGTVVAWGDDFPYGQTDVPAGLSNVTAIAGGAIHSLALKSDGTVVAWGSSYASYLHGGEVFPATVPPGLTGVIRDRGEQRAQPRAEDRRYGRGLGPRWRSRWVRAGDHTGRTQRRNRDRGRGSPQPRPEERRHRRRLGRLRVRLPGGRAGWAERRDRDRGRA